MMNTKLDKYFLRRAENTDVSEIRLLVNLAYKELADLNLNYTGAYQDEQTTSKRINQGKCFVLIENTEIIATVIIKKTNYYTNKNTAYVNQLAVHPRLKQQGIGSLLMNYCENLAKEEGFTAVQLDTAKPAIHLVNWYLKIGYKIVGEIHWEGKNYDSWIFEKDV